MANEAFGLGRFQEYRQRTADRIAELRDLAADIGLPWQSALAAKSMADWLEQSRLRLLDRKFHLAIVGEFSVGKSFFINALLRQVWWDPDDGPPHVRGLLPDDILPTTATVTVLEHGEALGAVLVSPDGSREEVPLDRLREVAAIGRHAEAWHDQRKLREIIEEEAAARLEQEKVQPEDAEEAVASYLRGEWRELHVTCPSEYLEGGITIVDTPGLGSVYPFHRLQTLIFCARADAVVFLVHSNPPVGETELQALEQIRTMVQGAVFFVQSMKDREDRAEHGTLVWRKAQEHNASRISAIVGQPVTVYPVSSLWEAQQQLGGRPAGDSGFAELRAVLESFLAQQRGLPSVRYQLDRTARVAEHIDSYLQRHQERMALSVTELADQLSRLEPKLRSLEKAGGQAQEELKGRFAELGQECQGRLRQLRDSLSNSILQQLPSRIIGVPLQILKGERSSLSGELQNACVSAFTKWYQADLKPLVTRRVSRAVREANRHMRQEISRLELAIDWAELDLDDGSAGDFGDVDAAVDQIRSNMAGAAVATALGSAVIGAVAHHFLWGAAVGLPGAIVGALAVGIFGAKMVLQSVRPKVEGVISDFCERVHEQISEQLASFQDRCIEALRGQVSTAGASLRHEYERLIDERQRGAATLVEAQERLGAWHARLETWRQDTQSLRSEILSAMGEGDGLAR